jgi:hypothetical protein
MEPMSDQFIKTHIKPTKMYFSSLKEVIKQKPRKSSRSPFSRIHLPDEPKAFGDNPLQH